MFTLVIFILHWSIVLLQRSPRCANLALKHYMLKPIQRIPQYKLLLQGKVRNAWGTMLLKQEIVINCWNAIVLFLSILVTSVIFGPRQFDLFFSLKFIFYNLPVILVMEAVSEIVKVLPGNSLMNVNLILTAR